MNTCRETVPSALSAVDRTLVGGEPDTAVVLRGLEPGREHVVADGRSHTAQQVVVHTAHEVALFVDQGVERAVGERDVVAGRARFVALLGEHRQRGIEEGAPTWPRAGDRSRPFAESAPLLKS